MNKNAVGIHLSDYFILNLKYTGQNKYRNSHYFSLKKLGDIKIMVKFTTKIEKITTYILRDFSLFL